MEKILIVEDDTEINSILAEFLSARGYQTFSLFNGLKVMKTILQQQIDLVLLDLMLPYKSGDTVLSEIRTSLNIPIIILSAKGTTQNKIDLLRLGADDYVTKPFDLEEVLARIESNLRRGIKEGQERILQFQNIEMHPSQQTVFLNQKELSLTSKEYHILMLLLQYPDKIFSKANLFQTVWGEEYLSEDNTLNVHISNLRNKLKAFDTEETYIDTVWGIGYRLHKK